MAGGQCSCACARTSEIRSAIPHFCVFFSQGGLQYVQVTLHEVCRGLRVNQIPWLPGGSNGRIHPQQQLLRQRWSWSVLGWLLRHLAFPLIRSHFFVTETKESGSRMCVRRSALDCSFTCQLPCTGSSSASLFGLRCAAPLCRSTGCNLCTPRSRRRSGEVMSTCQSPAHSEALPRDSEGFDAWMEPGISTAASALTLHITVNFGLGAIQAACFGNASDRKLESNSQTQRVSGPAARLLAKALPLAAAHLLAAAHPLAPPCCSTPSHFPQFLHVN